MEKYKPDLYQKSVYSIDYDKLKERGIECLLIDLDNTLISPFVKVPNDRLKKLFQELKEKGFHVILFSNALKRRVRPFQEALGVEAISFACKPSKRKYLKVLEKNHYNESQVAMIGDQLLTDVLGGNKAGITTILINPVSPKDHFPVNLFRCYERHIMKKLRGQNLFVRGKYYE